MKSEIIVNSAAIDILCPLHVYMDQEGVILHTGPTMAKLRETSMIGRPFWHFFEFLRPKKITSVAQVAAMDGRKLHMRFREAPYTNFKGVAAISADGVIANLSFGIGLVDAVRTYGLRNSDFAGTDLAIEMLYLNEAKSAAFHESNQLTNRLASAQVQAEAQANSDPLTGLKNRRAMANMLQDLVTRNVDFACMQLDLDFFKSVNDTFGHAAGDHILLEVSKILLDETRKGDCVARVGGDEFVLLFVGLTDKSILNGIAKRIIERLEVPVKYKGHICEISGSAGTAISSSYEAPDIDTMLLHADTALYASKEAGRRCHHFYSDKIKRLAS